MAGTIGIAAEDRPVFDFVDAAKWAVDAMGREKVRDQAQDVWEYTRTLSQRINGSLKKAVSLAQGKGLSVRYPDNPEPGERGSTIAHLFILGYYRGSPQWARARFWHEAQDVQPAHISSRDEDPLRLGYPPRGYGSRKIAELLYEREDPRFADFIGPKPNSPEDLTLLDAAKVAENYIRACCTALARQLDPEHCNAIGDEGIHIATISPSRGNFQFAWVPGFEPKDS